MLREVDRTACERCGLPGLGVFDFIGDDRPPFNRHRFCPPCKEDYLHGQMLARIPPWQRRLMAEARRAAEMASLAMAVAKESDVDPFASSPGKCYATSLPFPAPTQQPAAPATTQSEGKLPSQDVISPCPKGSVDE